MTDEFADIEVDPEIEREFTDAKAFLNGLKGAKEFGLEEEYVVFVLQALKRGEGMAEAIWYAQCEWDL